MNTENNIPADELVEIKTETKQYFPNDFYMYKSELSTFLKNNSHPLFDHIKEVLFARYKVVMKFSIKIYGNAGNIWVNNVWLVARKKKFGPVYLNKHVKLIEGKATKAGGSNAYPLPTFKEGYCILEFECHGLPITEGSGWRGEIISLEKITENTTSNNH